MVSWLDVVANLNLVATRIPSYLAYEIVEDASDSLSIGCRLMSFLVIAAC